MRINIRYILMFLPFTCLGQGTYSLVQPFFLGRVPSARAEALGKAHVAADGDMAGAYFNPAGIANLKGVEWYGSRSSPYYIPEAYYTYLSIGARVNEKLCIGVTRHHFNYNFDFEVVDTAGNRIGAGNPYHTNNTLTTAYELLPELYAGVNVHYHEWRPFLSTHQMMYADLGLLKKFKFEAGNATHGVSLAASWINVNQGKSDINYISYSGIYAFPSVLRVGLGYNWSSHSHVLSPVRDDIRLTVLGEYQHVWRDPYDRAYRLGAEMVIEEIWALRLGFYRETADNLGVASNYTNIDALTYGAGVRVPFYSFTRMPLCFSFDLAVLPQPPRSVNSSALDRSSTTTCKLTWLFDRYRN